MMSWRLVTLALALGLAALLALSPAGLVGWQERLFDRMPGLPVPAGVTVIDIGAADETGRPWDRAATARLVAVLAQTHPSVLGFDMLIAGDCNGRAAADLARALAGVPAVMGVLLTDGSGPALPPSPLGLAGPVPLWPAEGVDAPCPAFANATWAAMVLMGDADGTVRRVPVGALVAGQALPGLAVAIAATAAQGQPLAGADWLHIDDGPALPTEAGSLRLTPSTPDHWAARSLAAADVLAGRARPADGAVLILGSSLPQRGGLRPTAASPVTPSVQIQADAVAALLAGHVMHRPGWAPWAEAAVVLALALATLGLLARTTPGRAAALAVTAMALWSGAAVLAAPLTGRLIDPVFPPAFAALCLLVALIGRAAAAARAERALRARMGQLLPPALVTRLAARPDLMRLEGELREVTALFTDIEGFSTATAAMGATEMVAKLDAYFTLTSGIVLRHGGMIDKLVGDSVHALFNAPLDQPGHEAAALACAADIITATEAFRQAHGGFGRTRIGLECGPAVLGDVGFGSRIDYTAHGPAVNLAARLQDANKELGTQICIGPTLGARLPGLTPLGETEVRSFGRVPLYTLRA